MLHRVLGSRSLALTVIAVGFLLPASHAQFCNSAGFVANITPTATVQSSGALSGDQRYWTFTATAGVIYNFYTCGATEQDTYLRIYNGNGGGTLVAEADQGCASGNLSDVTFTAATTGVHSVHLSRWANFLSTCANLNANSTLFYRTIPPPANDLVCNAISVACGSTTSGTTVGAGSTGTYEGTSTCGTAQAQPAVWYSVAGFNGFMTASLCATSGWDSKISVYSGTCTSLTCIGGNDDNGPSCTVTPASFSWPGSREPPTSSRSKGSIQTPRSAWR
ncbi:MAG: PPC domain-containing protein [Flavobacteriales bacterium]|nr:PPC domain-containing protein [Flavobacteriales bacterium]